jgi:hypothetical protein
MKPADNRRISIFYSLYALGTSFTVPEQFFCAAAALCDRFGPAYQFNV